LIGWFSCAFRNVGEKKWAGKSFNSQFLLIVIVILILILAEFEKEEEDENEDDF
jgi:hypothetical protein